MYFTSQSLLEKIRLRYLVQHDLKNAFINKNHALNKRFNISVFNDNQSNDVGNNRWVIQSIKDETAKIDINWLDGLRILENSKLLDRVIINMLLLELDSKLFINNRGNFIFININNSNIL